jgi:ParB family transcriptional regulator, chromosome partitioning protein
MRQSEILNILISEIVITNPRARHPTKWREIVTSIRAVGLKRPITVSLRRMPTAEGKRFDLVCGQGRVEAFKEMGETSIPAIITKVSREDQFLMGLIENLARRQPSNRDILREVTLLRARGYNPEVIANKLGVDRAFIYGLVHLVETGEERLVEHVEAGRLPIGVAIEIARGDDHALSLALSEAYQSGQLRGKRLTVVRKLVAARSARQDTTKETKMALTPGLLVTVYKQSVQKQQALAAKAANTNRRLVLLCSVFRQLLQDETFLELVRAENPRTYQRSLLSD